MCRVPANFVGGPASLNSLDRRKRRGCRGFTRYGNFDRFADETRVSTSATDILTTKVPRCGWMLTSRSSAGLMNASLPVAGLSGTDERSRIQKERRPEWISPRMMALRNWRYTWPLIEIGSFRRGSVVGDGISLVSSVIRFGRSVSCGRGELAPSLEQGAHFKDSGQRA